MRIKSKALLSLFLIVWVLFSLFLFINHGSKFIGKSYFDSDAFIGHFSDFKSGLGQYVLQPFDKKAAKEAITVSKEEIDYHRNYYGSLTEQVENIKWQYEERINNATDTDLQEMLIKERDAKIEDIKKNFSDDSHVEEKIRKQKEAIIEQYAASENERIKQFLDEYNYFSYSFTNVDTGESYEFGDVDADAVFKVNFGGKQPLFVVDSSRVIVPNEYDYTLLDPALHVGGKVSRYEGTITIPKSMMSNSLFKDDYQRFTFSKICLYGVWATALLAIVGLLTFAKPSLSLFLSHNRMKEYFLKMPIDVRIGVTLILILIAYSLFDSAGNNIRYNVYYYWTQYWNILEIIISFAFLFIFTVASIYASLWTWESVKSEEKLKAEIKNAILYRLADGIQDIFLNRSIGIQALVILTVAYLAGFGLAIVFMEPVTIFIYAVLFFFIALPALIIFLRNAGYLNRIMKQTKEMAEGRLTTEVMVKGKSPLAKHAQHLNELQEGVRKSLMEQAKSERLKTELITNVSHDLRTPLTSIITYTDLLKNPDITEEERKHYIEVLEKKSARLKTLIEDLFEVSKMSSGNIELHRERIDLTQLLQQAIGEHKESFEKANLDLRVTLPEKSLYAFVDGQKWWRVIDNLIGNALKYSLEGTRVYVALKKVGSIAELSVKNISNYELGDNVEELTERFKRADESRHTEGSGLGLAIAQSIVDLHHGKMVINVDGDLFKVVVTVEAE